jgi:hypothetical protein
VLDRLRAASAKLDGQTAAIAGWLGRSRWTSGRLPALLLLATAAAMFEVSWGTWPDVLVDFGHELYVPWRLSEGAKLSTDLLVGATGPLSPYLNALLFAVTGPSLRALVTLNLALLAVITTLLFLILRRLAGPLTATAALLVFLVVFGFGQYVFCGNYNYLTPYSHGITHGLLLALLGLWLADRSAEGGGARGALVGAGLALGLAALTKPEVLVATAAAVGLRVLLSLHGAGRAQVARTLATLLLAALAAPLLAVLLLSIQDPVGVALATAFRPWVLMGSGVAQSPFYLEVTGLDRPAEHLAVLLKAFGAVALSAAGVALLDLAAARARLPRALASLVGLGLGAGLWRWLTPADPVAVVDQAAHPLPFAVLLGALVCLIRWTRAPDEAARRRAALGLSAAVLAGLLLGKMALNPRLSHYGFALAMPATLLSVTWLVGSVPAALRAWSWRGLGGGGALFRGAALAAVAALTLVHLDDERSAFSVKQVAVGRGDDRFVADFRGRFVNEMVSQLARLEPKDGTLAVIPEGIMINYLSRRVNPTPYVTYLPDALGVYGEEAMLGALMRDPPEFVVVVFRDASEFGTPFFGLDYGQKTAGWLSANYALVTTAGSFPNQRQRYGMGLLRWRHPRAGRAP